MFFVDSLDALPHALTGLFGYRRMPTQFQNRQPHVSGHRDHWSRHIKDSQKRKHDYAHVKFLLRQLPLPPEIVPLILDSGEMWLSDEAVIYLDPRGGYLEVNSGHPPETGQQLLVLGPLSPQQAGLIREVSFTVKCSRQALGQEPNYSYRSVAWFEGYVTNGTDLKRAMSSEDPDADRIMDNTALVQSIETYEIVWRYDDDNPDVRQRMRHLKAGDYIHLIAHCNFGPGGESWTNIIQAAKIVIRYNTSW